jgi:death-on-curing protein
MPEVRYLNADDVLAISATYSTRLGYAEPILRANGRGLLESAVQRAENAAFYGRADLIEQAAVLCDGIALNRPFVDGNKRSAFAACLTFLDANGVILPASAVVALAQQIIARHDLTDRTRADHTLADWLRAHVAQP